MKEIWKDIPNYENYYEVSNYGKIRRIKYYDNGNKKERKLPYYLTQRIEKDGYLRVALTKHNKTKYYFVHRLVASAFLKQDKTRNVVNHKDGNKENNFVGNLEWCTIQENNLHALKNGLRDMKNNKLSKPICQYDLEGNFIKEYKSSCDAERQNEGMYSGNIRKCCKGQFKTAFGYIWKYKVN